ncbi:MAG: acyloxyacyl hydrolase [Alphaproteobacteria bacterium]
MQVYRLVMAFGLVLGGFIAALGLMPTSARAGEDAPSFLVGGIGAFDLVQDDDTAIDFRLEYRHGTGLWFIKPWIGIEGTSDGAIYGLGGLLADIPLGQRIVVTPSFGIGAYGEGDGKDLGNTVEFRSQIELAYRFDNRSRIGVAFSHISNAGIGDQNPGTEILNVYYAYPLDGLFGQ